MRGFHKRIPTDLTSAIRSKEKDARAGRIPPRNGSFEIREEAEHPTALLIQIHDRAPFLRGYRSEAVEGLRQMLK
jgi:hypothetical protein